ncbi:ParB/RepB/Spo0J family partition protein [Paramagnetospirillum magneticum]|uniref:Predicted transcriptional regulator n=1 Tax=Paramagnetospirillum magneticum (strain ATCC 700264 / AMB-1) TaxID=342108 RepID=Q2W769_PARM1|nr:ParB/RepB/Spo0J family partition protein [Paramagnetospirillum magneticum]BAE50306.1 Predicted transcriptional regulator [Paramagnetospirillum magneticum AMB-1]
MGKQKLTPEQEREIYDLRQATPAPSFAEIGTRFGVDKSAAVRAYARAEAAIAAKAGPSLPAQAPAVVPMGVSAAPHDRIAPSPLNPRQRIDEDELTKLVDSVRIEGVLLPLLVRYARQAFTQPTDPRVEYEIIAGERRWQATRRLIDAGERPADTPLPIRLIDPCDDAKLLELALTENVARKDMTPWEEAEAFEKLRKLGRSAAEIAATVGMVKRTVEMRLRLVRDLDVAAKDALRDGRITVEAANILAAFCPLPSQSLALDQIAKGSFPTTRDLKRYLTQSLIPTTVAFFPPAEYTGELIADESDPNVAYFADAKLFEKLQQKAIAEAEIKARAKGYAWTRVIDGRKPGEYFSSWDWETDKKDPARGVVYEIKGNGLVVVHTDLVSKAERTKQAASAAGLTGDAPAEQSSSVTKGHYCHARRRKTVALQTALSRSPVMAMRAACLALIGCGENVRIRTEHLGADDKAWSQDVEDTIAHYLPRFADAAKKGFEIAAGDVRRKDWGEADNGAAWGALAAMTDAEVGEFFAALVALRVGSFATYSPEAGDRPAVVGMARSLGLIGAEEAHGLTLLPEDLDGLRKPALLDVWAQVSPNSDAPDVGGIKGLREDIVCQAPPTYVLPSLRFGLKAEIEAALKATPPAGPDPRQIDLEEAIAAKGVRDISLETIVAALAPVIDNPFAPTGETPLFELVPEARIEAAAGTLARAFGLPSITPDVLLTIEDLDHLALVLENHRAALATGEAA